MKILVDINHPAHIHFFRHFIHHAQKMDHQVFIAASDKDIAINLLKEYQIPYYLLPSYGKNIFHKIINIFRIDLIFFLYARKIKPDIIMGIASFRVAHAASLLGAKSFIFDDTEHSTFEIALYKPFATKIFSPSCFYKNLGKKHHKYKGYHELAYLHPERFNPDVSVINSAGIKEGESFFVVRFVSWNAGHDIGQKGLTYQGKKKLVELLLKYGKVFITSEYPLDNFFEPFRITLPSNKIHHLLYYSSMYIGEGGTMASESAVLGTPSIFISSLTAGTFTDLQNNYGLMLTFINEEEAFLKIKEMLEKGKQLKAEWNQKKEKMLNEKIDVTEWMLSLIN